MASVLSVNVGRPREASWTTIGRTSIDKTSIVGPVRVGDLGLEGDEVSNRRHHGGAEKAVYAFAREDLDHWQDVLDCDFADGFFGENLTTSGIDVNGALLGERWRIGGVMLEIASVRTPCNVFRAWMGRHGHRERGLLQRFAAEARPGPYLRVVEPGVLRAGDPIEVVHRPGHDVDVSYLFRAVHGEADLLPRLLEADVVDHVPAQARRRAARTAP